jgi:hypothetical protein
MGTVRIAKGDLMGLDALSVEALALTFNTALKQPSAVAGFVDWRLAGRLARMMLKKRFNGGVGETLLMSSMGRLGAVKRIFLFGLGEEKDLSDAELASRAVKMMGVLHDAGARQVALAGPAKLLSQWLEIAKSAKKPFEEVVLLDPDGTLAANARTVSQAAKRGGFEWSGQAV